MPSSESARGSAKSLATRGIPAWNAVSKQATCGTVGYAERIASMAAIAWGMWLGSIGMSSRSSATTSGTIPTGSRYRFPPCTIRCPVVAHPPQPLQHGRQRGDVVGKVDTLPAKVFAEDLLDAEPPVAGADPLGARTEFRCLPCVLRTIQGDLEAGGAGIDGQDLLVRPFSQAHRL